MLGGAWVLTRYADIVDALQDPRLSSARADIFAKQFDAEHERKLEGFTATAARWLIFMNSLEQSTVRQSAKKKHHPDPTTSMLLFPPF